MERPDLAWRLSNDGEYFDLVAPHSITGFANYEPSLATVAGPDLVAVTAEELFPRAATVLTTDQQPAIQ